MCDGPGNAYPLLLPPRKGDAPFSYHGIEPVRKARDIFKYIRDSSALHYQFIFSLGFLFYITDIPFIITKQYIVGNRFRKQEVILWHIAKLLPVLAQVYIPDVCSVYEDIPFACIIRP